MLRCLPNKAYNQRQNQQISACAPVRCAPGVCATGPSLGSTSQQRMCYGQRPQLCSSKTSCAGQSNSRRNFSVQGLQ